VQHSPLLGNLTLLTKINRKNLGSLDRLLSKMD